ncbi:apolipo protein O-domain-containing protein, partial [Ephemerocybe angulata]
SIYPRADPDVLLVETSSPLEEQIGAVRRQVQGVYADGHSYVQGWISKWIGIEHAVENRVKSIISPHESLTPGLLYVGVATLTGSILTRTRALPTRILLPPLFLVFSARHFLPNTTANLGEYLGNLEEVYLPTLAEKHEVAKAHSEMAWERVKEKTVGVRRKVDEGVEGWVEKVQGATGLKIKETLGL